MEQDMKIAPKEISKALKQQSTPETDTVMDYLFQKRSGNITKAHKLGRELAEQCIDHSSDNVLYSAKKFIALSTFCIVDGLKNSIKDPILSNTVIATYYDTIEELDSISWDYLTEGGDISLYYYNGTDKVGEAFSELVSGEMSEVLVKKGEDIASHWKETLEKLIGEKRFLA